MCPLDGIRNALCASLCNASIFLANAQRTSTSWVRGDLPAIPLKNPAHELVFEALDMEADGRLREVYLACSLGEAARLYYRN